MKMFLAKRDKTKQPNQESMGMLRERQADQTGQL